MSLIRTHTSLLSAAGDEEEGGDAYIASIRSNQISNQNGLEEARVWLKTMAALITVADTVPISSADPDASDQTKPETATCHCCGLIEECTLAYIAAVSRRYNGRWICGLCSEAVADEICRSKGTISTEEAVNRHVSFCRRSGDPPVGETAENFIAVVRQILRRRLDSPRAVRSPAVAGIGGD